MKIRNIIRTAAIAAIALIPSLASAQLSSINTFSPYTFYGLGDFHTQGPANLRSMGGASIGYRAFVTGSGVNGIVNYTNPASLSATPQHTFHFNFGMEGSNHYLSSADKNTSFNTFNIRDIVFQTPLAKGLGMSISLTPFSSVGYRTQIDETDQDLIAKLYGSNAIGVQYLHSGSGDINQGKISIGWEPVKRFSIGLDMVYYFGKITRDFTTNIIPIPSGTTEFINTQVTQTERVSRIMWNIGTQVGLLSDNRRQLILGATYNFGGRLNPEVATYALNSLSLPQYLEGGLSEDFKLPETISVGLTYQTWRMSAGIDYSYQGWDGLNPESEVAGGNGKVSVAFRNTNTIRAGIEYTPQRYDVRKLLRRFTYRVGVSYSDYYMKFNDTDVNTMGVTMGLGIPLRAQERSYMDIGVEYGRRGTTDNNLIKENYFKVSIGFRLFGTDDWFRKFQFN